MGLRSLTVGAASVAGVLAGIQAAIWFGVPVPRAASLATAALAMVLALGALGRCGVLAWGGPVVVAFGRRDAVLCDVAEAAAVRAAARLRGTMGGAGHVHPGRIVFPALAWAAIAFHCAASMAADEGAPAPWPLAVAAVGVALAVVFPARAFWYREASGGCVLASPAAACRRILRTAGVGPALTHLKPVAREGLGSGGPAARSPAPPAFCAGPSREDATRDA